MHTEIASRAGFCAGVKRAFEITQKAVSDPGKWYTFGPLVHNQAVIDYFSDQGILPVESLDEIREEAGIIIRSHGVSPEIIRQAKIRGLQIKDATCPRVKKIHEIVRSLKQQGYDIIIFGDSEHPEVKSILGWCEGQATVVSSLEDLKKIPIKEHMGIVSQTTKDERIFHQLVEFLSTAVKDLKVYNTICSATRNRQEAARELCQKVQVMIVVGGENSSNTATLYQECLNTGVKTYLLRDVSDIKPEWFKGVSRVGITAGASTPDWIIKEVLYSMTEFEEKDVQVVEPEASPTEELTVEKEQGIPNPQPEENTQENKPSQTANDEGNAEIFARMEAEMAEYETPGRGDVIKGTVVQVLDDEVMVDVGGKSEGIVPLRELTLTAVDSARELVKVGDEIEVMIMKWDDDGTILLSKKRVDSKKVLDELEEKYNNGETVEGKIKDVVKGGLIVDVGVVGFLPASHIEDGYVKNLEEYKDKTFDFKIIEFNRNKRRGSQVVLSRRELVLAEKEKRKQEFWSTIQEGQVRQGKVKRLVDYGAFIDLGGYEGLLHVSELDHKRIEHPADVLQEGDELEVYVLGIDSEKERVSLSRKKLLKSPWEIAMDTYKQGDIVDGTIVRIAPFGAFVELDPGVDGLVHISQLADYRVEKPEDVVSVNQKVKVKILSIDANEKRIGLSIKEAQKEQEQQEVNQYLDQQDQ